MENKAILRTRTETLPLAEMKKIVADLFHPKRWIYWTDLMASVGIAYGSFVASELSPALSLQELFFFSMTVVFLYRGVLFVHELTHQERRDLPGFSVAWNLFVGIPLMLPSFMYRGVHIDHHRSGTYSTAEDGEYLPFGASPFWRTIFYLGQSILLPFLVVFRFGVLAPLSLLHPQFRLFVMRYTSALAIRMDTARRIPTDPLELRNWHIQEALTFLYVLTGFILFYTGALGLGTLRHFYLLFVAVAFLNSIRTVVAHRYINRSEKPVSFSEQYADSVNVEGPSLLMEIVAPVGLRYHALHHVFANMPYHNLGIAYRRLQEQLPAESLFHVANEPTLWSALRTHWKNTQLAHAEDEKVVNGHHRA